MSISIDGALVRRDGSPWSVKKFERHEVADYEKRRYRGLDQRLVDGREKRILRRLLVCLRKKAGRARPEESPVILDAPCGYGRFSALVGDRGFRIVSCDLSPNMVSRTLERLRPEPGRGVVADLVRGLPFKAEAFDGILSMRLFHHLHREADRRAVLSEFARAARGGVVLSYYQMTALHILQRRLRRLLGKGRYEIKMISRRQFDREAEESGFRVVRAVPLIRGIHAQRIAWLEKKGPASRI